MGHLRMSKNHYVQKFHRDDDGFLSFSAMILLTDTDENNGATELSIKKFLRGLKRKISFFKVRQEMF